MWRFWVSFSLFCLILIHTIDMLLTDKYVGNNWKRETFPIMSYTIKYCGIDAALWLSRLVMYLVMFFLLCKSQEREFRYLLYLITILYYTAMIPWLFTLNLVKWPFPC